MISSTKRSKQSFNEFDTPEDGYMGRSLMQLILGRDHHAFPELNIFNIINFYKMIIDGVECLTKTRKIS